MLAAKFSLCSILYDIGREAASIGVWRARRNGEFAVLECVERFGNRSYIFTGTGPAYTSSSSFFRSGDGRDSEVLVLMIMLCTFRSIF